MAITVITAVFNGEVFEPITPVKLDKNTLVKIIVNSEETTDNAKNHQEKLSDCLLLPELEDNEIIFTRDNELTRNIEL